MAPRTLQPFTLPLTVDGTAVEVDGLHRDGIGAPVVFLHGFGSSKEDYADVIFDPELATRPVLAYDAPGCGASQCSNLAAVSIPFLVSVATEVLDAHGITGCHLVGHSMGGLTALMLAHQNPSRVASFVSIEGNLAPEDCFLSRQILTHPHDDPEQFLAAFAERVRASHHYSSSLYAAALPHRVRAGAVPSIFESMVELSDGADLFEHFVALPAPKLFMYGCQNNQLSYLEDLRRNNVQLAEIAHSAHFPMYSNPPQMWRRIADFLTVVDHARNDVVPAH